MINASGENIYALSLQVLGLASAMASPTESLPPRAPMTLTVTKITTCCMMLRGKKMSSEQRSASFYCLLGQRSPVIRSTVNLGQGYFMIWS